MITRLINKSVNKINQLKNTFLIVSIYLFTPSVWANGSIPTPPSDQQITNGQSLMDVIRNIIKDAVPIVFPALELVCIVVSLWLILTSLQDAKKKDDWGVMKAAIFWAAVLVGIAFTLAYEGNQIGSSM